MPAPEDYFLNKKRLWALPPGGGGVSDGDKGNITVTGTGTIWTIDDGVVTNAKLAGSIDNTKLLTNPLARANHTGTQLKSTISDFSHTHPKTEIDDTGTWETTEIPNLDAAKITTGQFPIARLGSGTADSTKFIRDDGTLQTPQGGGGINTLKKTATQIINGTAFQDISGLTFSVVNGTNYAFKYYIVFRSVTTTTGFRFGLNCPTGTLDYFHTYQTIANSATVGVATWLQRHDVTRDSMTVLGATITAGVDLVCMFEGRYLCTANGTFAPRVASELANNDLVIQIGSWGTWF